MLCRYNSWHPRLGLTFSKGSRKTRKAARIINDGIVRDYQQKIRKAIWQKNSQLSIQGENGRQLEVDKDFSGMNRDAFSFLDSCQYAFHLLLE